MNPSMRPRIGPLAVCLLPFALLSPGCQNKDAECLAALGSRLAEKAHALLAPPGGPLRSLQGVPLRIGEMSIEARVTARLKWDKSLAESAIQVTSIGDSVVELAGKVRDVEDQRRAVEMAQTTVGVEKVIDKLEITAGTNPN